MNWINYLLQVNLYLILTFGFYWLVLRRETFYNANRFYLVVASLLAFGIPFWQSGIIQSWSVTEQVSSAVSVIPLQEFTITNLKEEPSWNWNLLLVIIYFFGFGFGLLRFSIGLFKLQQLFNLPNLDGHAFSVFGKIFIDKKLEDYQTIKNHEEVHSKQFHSLDVFWFELLGVVCWFNPISHFMQKEIKLVHEYIADENAALILGSKKAYAQVLVGSHFKANGNVLVNNFYNNSILKTRIMMLSKQKSKKTAVLKYGLIAPLFLGMLILSSANVLNAKSTIIALAKNTVQNGIDISGIVLNEENKPASGVFIQALGTSYKTKTDINGKFFIKNLPINTVLQATYDGTKMLTAPFKESSTTLLFKFGKKNDLKLNNTPNPIVTKPDTSITSYNDATSAGSLNEMVVVGYKSKNVIGDIFTASEILPEFPGGVNAMYKFIAAEIKYPPMAQRANIQGRVFVKFIVNKDGYVVKPEILKGLGFGLDQEVFRVIDLMPRWNPGMQNGKPINSYFTMPFLFELEEDNSEKNTSNEIANALIIIDGKEMPSEFNIKSVNKDNVESVTVLKDEAAKEKYGEKGKNGVVIIKMKKQ
jgi:TonB family protein